VKWILLIAVIVVLVFLARKFLVDKR